MSNFGLVFFQFEVVMLDVVLSAGDVVILPCPVFVEIVLPHDIVFSEQPSMQLHRLVRLPTLITLDIGVGDPIELVDDEVGVQGPVGVGGGGGVAPLPHFLSNNFSFSYISDFSDFSDFKAALKP